MDTYIHRCLEKKITSLADLYSVVIVTGPRQSGKTTLCKHLFSDYKFVNLELPSARNFALTDPEGFIDSLGSKAIIDEIQVAPDLFSTIQARVDENPDLRFALTGSSNFSLMQSVTQSLAGRAAVFTLLPLEFSEIKDNLTSRSFEEIAFSGFYPGTVSRGIDPTDFYNNYYQTYVERDLRQLSQIRDISKFETFLGLCAGRVGSEFNASSLAVETGVSSVTVTQWLSLLKTSYILFDLQPFYANINKRLTKSPKIYFYDTGLLSFLLGLESPQQLITHPLRGAIFENLVVSQLVKRRLNQGKLPKLFFYRERSGREVDVISQNPLGLEAYEIKVSKTYRPEFRKNLEYLKSTLPQLVKGYVTYDGATFSDSAINFREL